MKSYVVLFFGLIGLMFIMAQITLGDDEYEDDDEYADSVPSIDPATVKIYEQKEDGEEVCIQREDGLVGENYFDKYMNVIMNDFYECLNYYKASGV